jgi:hypothetical protein
VTCQELPQLVDQLLRRWIKLSLTIAVQVFEATCYDIHLSRAMNFLFDFRLFQINTVRL